MCVAQRVVDRHPLYFLISNSFGYIVCELRTVDS